MTNFQAVYRLDKASDKLETARLEQLKVYKELYKYYTARECQVMLMLDENKEGEISQLASTINTLIHDIKCADEQGYASRIMVNMMLKHAEAAVQRASTLIANIKRTKYVA